MAYTTKTFIEKARAVHNNKYDYSKVDYLNSQSKVTLICKEHGEWKQLPAEHLRNKGCPRCCKNVRGTQESFLAKAKLTHGDTYDYSKSVYRLNMEKLTITCRIHGDFLQAPNTHYAGKGCDKCADIANADRCRLPVSQFVADAEQKHGVLYDYSQVVYTGTHSKVKIICLAHGEFWQTPNSHKAGQGCKACAKSGFKTNIPGWLYILQCGDVTKVGITNRSVHTRVKSINNSSKLRFKQTLGILFENGSIADQAETILLRELRSLYQQPLDKFDGSTECFINVDRTQLLSRLTQVVSTLLTTN